MARITRTTRTAGVVAVVLTVLACAQQVLLVAGFGGWLPGWQPWPYLLVAAPAWLLSRPLWGERVPPVWERAVGALRRVPSWAYVAGVLAMAAGAWAVLQDFEPYLGHEEAVYANKARSWVEGTPDAGWGVYRPVGLPALGALALWLYGDVGGVGGVGALRAVALLLVLGMLTVTYFVAAAWTTRRRAVVVVLVLLSGLGFLRRVPEYLNDIGTTGLLLVVVFLLVRAQEKEGSRALWGVPAVALAAFYLRYGVVGNLLAIGLAAVFAYGPRAWLAQGRRLAGAGAVLALGLVPHFVHAVLETGRPLGMILSATSQANRAYVGDGLVYYLAVFPYRLAGDLGAVVMFAGLWAAGSAVRRVWGRSGGRVGVVRGDDRRRVFLGTAALLVFVILGFATDGEPRFVYLAVVLLTVLGVQAVAELAGHWSGGAWRAPVLAAVAALAGLTVLGTAQVVAHGAMPGPKRLSWSTVPVALEIGAAAHGVPCLVVTGYEPEFGWYSRCDAVTYSQYRKMRVPKGTRVSLVVFERGRLQPDAAGLERLIGGRDTDVRKIGTDGSVGTATVVTLR
ncbi:glycosyltransferase [Streptomyces sp. ISL-98]|uniref:glycosyltransferase n=1 Tax=Streptomyces sp. ISL-98 TaxID=2819192 RepID=UPI001BE5EB7F|nr:glycosyltransferase [Streptomyces sp. ISL-98]MBT2506642.1 glycosyltransferase [Streptomyces sp. ISL-98]